MILHIKIQFKAVPRKFIRRKCLDTLLINFTRPSGGIPRVQKVPRERVDILYNISCINKLKRYAATLHTLLAVIFMNISLIFFVQILNGNLRLEFQVF